MRLGVIVLLYQPYIHIYMSYKSLTNFIAVNGFLLSMASLNYEALIAASDMDILYFTLVVTFIVTLVKNYMLLFVIDYSLRNHQTIASHRGIDDKRPTEAYKGEFHVNVLSSTLIESICIYGINLMLSDVVVVTLWDIVYFVPTSLLFEIIFDFFHYWTHRLMHLPQLYRHSHKKHHKFAHPCAITTYYQHPLDIVVTNVVPTFVSLYMVMHVMTLSYYTFTLINMYKTYVEISGHCGKHLRKTTSFPQCIWLTRFLEIELSVDDHDTHHSVNNCNYAKRFMLWDKVFGTSYFLSRT